MNARATDTDTTKAAGRWSGLISWLLAQPRGRWITGRGRCLRIFLTLILGVTGVSAWAVALIQPWTGRTGYDPQVAAGAVLDAQTVQVITADLEAVCAAEPPAAPAPQRNLFAQTAGAAVVRPAAVTGTTFEPAAVAEKTVRPAAASSARAVLEAVKALRLEVTLVTPSGQRSAVINGDEYREGETVAGFLIVEIQEGKVKLQQAGVLCLLRME